MPGQLIAITTTAALVFLASCAADDSFHEIGEAGQGQHGATPAADTSDPHDEPTDPHADPTDPHGDADSATPSEPFESNSSEFSFEMTADAPVGEVFPLLGPVRENDWIPGWESFTTLIWSESGFAELGAVFQTAPGGSDPQTWVISEYIPNERVAFVRFSPDVVTRLGIDASEEAGKTSLLWTQNQTAISAAGVSEVAAGTQESYEESTAGFEAMLNYYLLTGELIDQETLDSHTQPDDHE